MAERIAIVVVGMHRSGSSAMARLLSLAGATLPNGLMHAGNGNETGHWEPQRVADYNDVVLAAFDATWDSPFGLGVNATRRAALAPFVEGARAIIREEYGDASPIVLKEPRMSLVADLWTEALEAEGYCCKFVITVRPPTEAAASLRKRNGFALDKGLLLWGAYVASAELLTRAHDRVFCRYDDVLVRPASVLDDIEAKLRIELPHRTAQAHAAMDAFVRPALKHNYAMTIPPIPPHLRPISELSDYIYASIVGEIPNIDVSRDLQTWFSDLDQTITPLMLGIEQRLQHEQEMAVAAANGRVEAHRLEVDRANALYHGQLADVARLNAQFAEIEAHRRDAEQRLAEVEQVRLATQACLDQREAEIEALHGSFEGTNRVVADLSESLEQRTAELAALNTDYSTKMEEIALLSDANTNLERAYGEANAALTVQVAESARVEGEAAAARAAWHDRETALVQHARGLADASEHAAREYAATLAQFEQRYKEERTALLTAAQAREAELEAALAAEVVTAQDTARLADEAIATLRNALAQAQNDAIARTTDLQQQIYAANAAKAESDAKFAEIEIHRRDAEQRLAEVEQVRLATQACLDQREAEIAALHGAFDATDRVVADLSKSLEQRTAELAALNADYHAKMGDIALLSDANTKLEREYAEANAALAAQVAESARVKGEAAAARADWHGRETALVQHAGGLADASEHAAREYAATLAQFEQRHEEERAALLTATQAREAELEAALATEVATAQDAARLADEAIATLRDALVRTQYDATARATDLQQQINAAHAAKAEDDASTAEEIAALTRLNDDMAGRHAEGMAIMAGQADEREATMQQLLKTRDLLQAEITQRDAVEAELRHAVAELTQELAQRDATLASHAAQTEQPTIIDRLKAVLNGWKAP
ncbi:hypothetical protein FSB78_02020 [Sphingomonas ginsenosidivorax]|uniref:Sulfotransferase family protein n=1 Tax=Sphingomonas ginsenosidivorax TaxID=862135 RepID=A0A5C6UAR8_9SPHN|nr:hypothetical protein [Sphingomonas ginsenosidivorax]TXC69869.1 hypothetical protein FSB78_02020 [Sphingomonas ginsenosidivorax]